MYLYVHILLYYNTYTLCVFGTRVMASETEKVKKNIDCMYCNSVLNDLYIYILFGFFWTYFQMNAAPEQEQLEKMDFRHSGKNGGTMASAFLPTRTHINGNPKDIYLFFFFFRLSLVGHPFSSLFFAYRSFFLFLYFTRTHETNK